MESGTGRQFQAFLPGLTLGEDLGRGGRAAGSVSHRSLTQGRTTQNSKGIPSADSNGNIPRPGMSSAAFLARNNLKTEFENVKTQLERQSKATPTCLLCSSASGIFGKQLGEGTHSKVGNLMPKRGCCKRKILVQIPAIPGLELSTMMPQNHTIINDFHYKKMPFFVVF